MNVQDIKTLAETFAGTTVNITNQKAVDAMVLALLTIADRTRYDFEIAAADYAGNVWNNDVLPENNLGVTEVNIDDSKNTMYDGYRVRDRDILFYNSGRFVIHYKTLATEPVELESELQVHPIYKDALKKFMLGYARLSKWDGDDSFAMQLLADFEASVAEKWRVLNKRTGDRRMVVVRHA